MLCISDNSSEKVENIIHNLIKYVESENFCGYDPYDALNSPILHLLGKSSKFLKIAFTQALRRSSINLRPLIGIDKSYNHKGMGLFLSSYVNLYRIYKDERYLGNIEFIADWLIKNHSKGYSGYCWGYNFDWQNRSFFAPKETPTIVNTSFIGHAFLDAYEVSHSDELLNIARSACDFIINDLNIYQENGFICFSYTPIDKSRVYNANYLGASLLVRTYSFTHEDNLLDYALKAYEYCTRRQKEDGSWTYGEAENQKWIDSFHTGFNLEALHWYEKCLNDGKYKDQIVKGLRFYLDNFFLDDGTPKYYHNTVYPINIHCSAQAFVSLSKLKDYDSRTTQILEKVFQWTMNNMRDKNYFYYQKHKFYKNKISYMRWSQAWMLYALTALLLGRNFP